MLDARLATAQDLEFCRSRDFSIKETSALLRKIEDQEIVVASSNGLCVGYLRWEKLWGKIPYMSVVNVLESHQGQGAGTAMLRFLEGQLAGKSELLLTSAESIAPRAIKWHTAQGFKECGYIDGLNPDGVREVFLAKSL